MNILFLLKSYEIGGLEVVTTVLANKFHSEGHHILLWAFYEGESSLRDRLNKDIPIIYGHGFKPSSKNIESLRKCLTENKIDIVINQWGLPFIPARTLKKAAKGLDVKIIAVYHNDPSTNGRLKDVEIAMERTKSFAMKLLLGIKYWCFKAITAASMRYVYMNSDKFMVLSPSFIDGFRKFTGLKNTDKLIVQTNPITIDTECYIPDFNKKQKEVLYVGRIDHNQKRVSRIVEMWSLLENKHQDWKLIIVGDGPERENLKKLSRDLNLSHISFEGFKDPKKYYERASILVLVSEYEGFGLVIVEAMSFGVVPVVLGSYSAVNDILKDGKTGVIVPYNPDIGFKVQEMSKRLDELMSNQSILPKMGHAAMADSNRFGVSQIYNEWNGLFSRLGGVNDLFLQKQGELIFVGRLDYSQKRVHRVIETWAQLEHRLPDWRLTIVGDGEERGNMERMVSDLELQRVSFEGFQQPRPYYERASMLILTSEFEGFPLVLAEAMSFGVVPVVYGSYSAVYDIIEDGKDGCIIPKTDVCFNAAEMAGRMAQLMENPEGLHIMAQAAIEKSKEYAVDKIYGQWMQVLNELTA